MKARFTATGAYDSAKIHGFSANPFPRYRVQRAVRRCYCITRKDGSITPFRADGTIACFDCAAVPVMPVDVATAERISASAIIPVTRSESGYVVAHSRAAIDAKSESGVLLHERVSAIRKGQSVRGVRPVLPD